MHKKASFTYELVKEKKKARDYFQSLAVKNNIAMSALFAYFAISFF